MRIRNLYILLSQLFLTLVVVVVGASQVDAAPLRREPGEGSPRPRAALSKAAEAAVTMPAAISRAAKTGVRVTDIGPEGGAVPGLDGYLVNPLNPSELLASSYLSVFKSTDAGKSWHPAHAGLSKADGAPAYVPNLRHAPGQPLTVFATSEDGLFRSDDFGEHWVARARVDLDDVAPSPANPALLFAVGTDYTTQTGVLYASTDGGTTFQPSLATGLPHAPPDRPEFTNVAFSATDPQTLFVTDYHSGVYRSTDGGASFTLIDSTNFLGPLQVFPHPSRRGVVFLQATYTATGLMVSIDGGASFSEVTGGLPLVGPGYQVPPGYGVQYVAFDPQDAGTLYAASPLGLFRSTDGGRTFAALGLTEAQRGDPQHGGAITLSVDPVHRRTLYVNTAEGNFKSVDGGRTFTAINRGFRATTVTGLSLAGAEGETLYAVADAYLFKSSDRGEYQRLPLPPHVFAANVAASPADPHALFLTTTRKGFFHSADGGRSWTPSVGDTTGVTGHITVDPRNPMSVYVVNSGVFHSADGGATFTTTNTFSGSSGLALDPQRPGFLYLTGGRGFDTPLLLKSVDGGASFTGTLPGLGFATSLALSPRDGRTVYVGGLVQQDLTKPYPSYDISNFLVRSSDGGATWVPADAGLFGRDVSWIGVDPFNPARVYVYSRGGYSAYLQGDETKLFFSEDGGLTWSLLDPLSGSFPGRIFALDPARRGRLFVGGASLLQVDTPP